MKKFARNSIAVLGLLLVVSASSAADLIGSPVDPFEENPAACGDGFSATVESANRTKSIVGEIVLPMSGPEFSKLGYAFLKGCGKIKQDLDEAVYWLEFAVKQEDPVAAINLAWMYQNGIGVEKNIQKAENYYQLVINKDYQPKIKKQAKNALAVLKNGGVLSSSNEIATNRTEIDKFSGKPIDPFEPNPAACGDGFSATVESANRTKSIVGEIVLPMSGPEFSKLGYAFLKGCGKIKQDLDEAKYWLEFAAKQEDAIAAFNLGWMYQNGISLPKDINKARAMYDVAAKAVPKLSALAAENLGAPAVARQQAPTVDINAGAAPAPSNRRAANAAGAAPLKISAVSSAPDSDGKFAITLQSSGKLVSLKINGLEEGAIPAGKRIIDRAVPVGTTKFKIDVIDEFGRTAQQEVSVTRNVAVAVNTLPALNPALIKNSKPRDAIALIIGIENYKNAPKAEFAEADASQFYDYARKGLGVPENRIKLLVGAGAGKLDILKQLKNWVAAEVNPDTTDIFVFYSGHGLASADGKTSYLMPYDADSSLLDESSIKLTDFVTSLGNAKPKSISLFMDSCYSGQGKNGATLLASARPLSINVAKATLPANVTMLTSAAGDQMAISAPEIRHGLFSYFLMKGMEGEADANRDGKISMQELYQYTSDRVSREATRRGKQQSPTLQGAGELVLLGR